MEKVQAEEEEKARIELEELKEKEKEGKRRVRHPVEILQCDGKKITKYNY